MEEFKKIITSFEPKQIGELLKNNIFIVPLNQRVYSWNKDNWQELWEDLLDVLHEKKAPKSNFLYKYHFFGPMFFVPLEKGEYRILDGQQRLVTISILLNVVYDLFDLIREKAKISREAASTLGKIDECLFKKKEDVSLNRISLGERNREFYEQIIKSKQNPLDKIDSLKGSARIKTNRDLLNCYRFFLSSIVLSLSNSQSFKVSLRKKIEKETFNKIITNKETEEFLIDLYSSAIDGFYVLLALVPTIDVVYEMFETLNQRGEKLMTVDLFKNFLFDKFENIVGSKKLKDFWDELMTIAGEEGELKFFLRHFWLSNYEFVREKKLFKSIKKQIDGMALREIEFDGFSNQLKLEASIYFALRNPEDNLWINRESISQILDEINYLGFTQALPLFLSVFLKYFRDKPKEFETLLKTYLNFAVRKYTILGESPSEFEEDYSLWARKIRNNEIKIEGVIDELKTRTPLGDEIYNRMQGLEIGERAAKYILSKVNDSLISTSLQSAWKNRPTVEHIIPKNPDDKWKEHLKSKNIVHKNVIKRLGNLSILSDKENKELGTMEYNQKRKKYLDTKLPINIKSFEDIEEFDMEAIKKREKIIAELIKDKKLWAN